MAPFAPRTALAVLTSLLVFQTSAAGAQERTHEGFEREVRSSIDRWESRSGLGVSGDLENQIVTEGGDALERRLAERSDREGSAREVTDRAVGSYLDAAAQRERTRSLDAYVDRATAGFSPFPWDPDFPIHFDRMFGTNRYGVLKLVTNSRQTSFELNGRTMTRAPTDKYVVPGRVAAVKVPEQGKPPCEKQVPLDLGKETPIECQF